MFGELRWAEYLNKINLTYCIPASITMINESFLKTLTWVISLLFKDLSWEKTQAKLWKMVICQDTFSWWEKITLHFYVAILTLFTKIFVFFSI